jgi:hypothetical protein
MPTQPQAFTSQKNKYKGLCRTCSQPLELDKPVHCVPVHDGSWRRYHVDCTPEKVEQRLMSLVNVHDGEVIETKGYDVWKKKASVKPEATDEEISRALQLYSRSGYPAPLRSYSYHLVERTSPTEIIVEVHEFLHD